MMTRKFKVENHPEYGTLGLAPQWMQGEQDDPLTGMGVAHDVLEHGPNDEVEWQGLGGSVHVRGKSYYHQRIGNPNAAENIGSDFVGLFHLWEGQEIPDPGRTYAVREDYAEQLIQDAVREGCKMVRQECDYDPKQARQWTNTEQRRRMVGWMRRGYRAAVHRWRAFDSSALLETFLAIEKAVDRLLKDDIFEGQEVELRFDIKRRVAYAAVVEEYDE